MRRLRLGSILATKWDYKIDLNLLEQQIILLQQDEETYHSAIIEFKKAIQEQIVTSSYDEFCYFWKDNLGNHPFLE